MVKTFAPYADPQSILAGRMYLGSFDDSVSRHPWLSTDATPAGLTRHLVLQSLLGPPVCFRVGNLLYHDAYFRALASDDVPVIAFAQSGFVQIHTKAASINETIAQREREGTWSTLEWIRKYDWKPGSPIFDVVERIDAAIPAGIGKRQYSPKFHEAFGRFASLAAAETDPAFQAVHAIWQREGRQGALTRNDFEAICYRTLTTRGDIQTAMSVINSVNHYAYGVGLFGIEERPLIDTSELESLRPYTTGFSGQDGRFVEFDVIDAILRKRVFKVVEEALSISPRLMTPGPHWRRYGELLAPDNMAPAAVAFRSLKVAICLGIRDCINGRHLPLNRKLLKENCQQLTAVIGDHLGFPRQPKRRIAVTLKAGAKVGFRAGAAAFTGGLSELALGDGIEIDFGVAIIDQAIERGIERIQDSVYTRDDGKLRESLPAMRSSLSWRYMDREACARDNLI